MALSGHQLWENIVFERVQFFLLAVAAIFAGGCVVVQQALNATLRAELGSAFWAAFISYAAGMLTLLFVFLAIREPWVVFFMFAQSLLSYWVGGVICTLLHVVLLLC